MSSEASKLLEQMQKSKAGWKPVDLHRLYEGFGFIIKQGGNHEVVTHPDFKEIKPSYIPRHRKLAVYVVVTAINRVEQLIQLRKQKEKRE